MTSQQLEEIMKKLDVATKKQDKYEQLFLKNEQDTAGTTFTGKLQEVTNKKSWRNYQY